MLRRAGCWVIPSGGDPKDSATEIDRQNTIGMNIVIWLSGKDGKVR